MTQTYLNDNHDDHDDLSHNFFPSAPVGAPDPILRCIKASHLATLLAQDAQPLTTTDLVTYWRDKLQDQHVQLAAARLGVPEDFLCEFDPGWIDEFGALALASIDEHGAPQGIEVVGIRVPSDVELDRSAIQGAYGHIVPTKTVRPGAPLAVDSDFAQLYAKWLQGANVGWRCGDTICRHALQSIAQHAQRIGASEIEHLADARRSPSMRRIAQAARTSALNPRRRRAG